MAKLQTLVEYTNDLLSIKDFADYCPNGLQIEGKAVVQKLVTGVTASLKFIEAAVAVNADAILVHHGYFWKHENPVITGMKRTRINSLLRNEISLLAYHLPLDAHPELGNNARLAALLGISIDGVVSSGAGKGILFWGHFQKALTTLELKEHLEQKLARTPLLISGNDKPIQSIAWCTGGAQNLIEEAVRLGVDAYLTGEVSEQTTHIAYETNIHFFAAGHHASERYGAAALGEHLADRFSLQHEFIDIDNPV